MSLCNVDILQIDVCNVQRARVWCATTLYMSDIINIFVQKLHYVNIQRESCHKSIL